MRGRTMGSPAPCELEGCPEERGEHYGVKVRRVEPGGCGRDLTRCAIHVATDALE